MWSIETELITGSLGAEPIKRAVKEAFHVPRRKLDSSHQWGLFSLADIQAGRAGWTPWHWKWCRHSGGEVAGTSSRLSRSREGDHTHTHTHSATLLLWSKQRLAGRTASEKLLLSGDGFYVNGSLNRRCVTALPAHWALSDPLLLVFN